MQLVIAEKPSVARNIAKVLHATNVKDGYLEGKEYLVSWCIGHLIELASADQYRYDWKAWKYETLPMIPENWKYQIKESTVSGFKGTASQSRYHRSYMCNRCRKRRGVDFPSGI